MVWNCLDLPILVQGGWNWGYRGYLGTPIFRGFVESKFKNVDNFCKKNICIYLGTPI